MFDSFFYQVFLKNKIMIGYKIHRFFLFKVMELEYILKNLSLHMGLILFQLFFLSLQILIQIQQRINYYYSFLLLGLFIVGNAKTLSNNQNWRELLEFCCNNNSFI